MGFTPIAMTMYVDRELTRWEWVKVRLLRRSDPRSFVSHTFGEDGSDVGRIELTMNSSGYFTFDEVN